MGTCDDGNDEGREQQDVFTFAEESSFSKTFEEVVSSVLGKKDHGLSLRYFTGEYLDFSTELNDDAKYKMLLLIHKPSMVLPKTEDDLMTDMNSGGRFAVNCPMGVCISSIPTVPDGVEADIQTKLNRLGYSIEGEIGYKLISMGNYTGN